MHRIYVDLIQTRTKPTVCCMTKPLFLVQASVIIYFERKLPVKYIQCLIFKKTGCQSYINNYLPFTTKQHDLVEITL